MADEFFLKMPDFHVTFRDLLHAINLRHGTNGFTSHPKEGVLRIFSPWKIGRFQAGLNPVTWIPKASTLHLDHRSRYSCLWVVPVASAVEICRRFGWIIYPNCRPPDYNCVSFLTVSRTVTYSVSSKMILLSYESVGILSPAGGWWPKLGDTELVIAPTANRQGQQNYH